MVIFIEFLFYLIFFIIKLYSLLDKKWLYSKQGSKLEKYISQKGLTNITCNLDRQNNNFFSEIISSFMSFKSLYGCKQVFTILLTGATIFSLKYSIVYKYLNSNFFVVTIFSKKIDIISSFNDYIPLFRFLYYLLSLIFIFYITNSIYINLYKKNQAKENLSSDNNKYFINFGKIDNMNIGLTLNGLFQNLLITGSIGSGKTSSAISNIVDELISKNVSGLILDIKGNYIETIRKIARKYSKEELVVEISIKSNFCYCPINNSNISTTKLAQKMRKVLTLISDNNLSDSFWLDKAEQFIKDFISLIKIYNKNINFLEIHKLVCDNNYLKSKIKEVKSLLLSNNYNDDVIFEVQLAINNLQNEYLNLDTRTVGIIKSEITRITSLFTSSYNISKKFDSTNDKIDFMSNKIYVLSINMAEDFKLAKVIATYLKLDFQEQVLLRKNFEKPIFFICDEYQEFVNEEDAHFLSLSREFKCINIVSMQSYSSLINNIKNENAAKVIIQNLVNKIWFRNDDIYTVNEIIKQIGKTIKKKSTLSISEGGQDSKYNLFFKKFSSFKSGISESYSLAENIEYKYNEEYFTQELKTFEAAAIISDGENIDFYDKIKLKRWEEEYEKK